MSPIFPPPPPFNTTYGLHGNAQSSLASWPECALADQGAHVMTIQTAPGAVTARVLASHTNAPEADLTGLGAQRLANNASHVTLPRAECTFADVAEAEQSAASGLAPGRSSAVPRPAFSGSDSDGEFPLSPCQVRSSGSPRAEPQLRKRECLGGLTRRMQPLSVDGANQIPLNIRH